MTTFDRITMLIIRITGVFQVLLGIVFWTGNLLQLVQLHMLVGAIFVVALWVLGVRGAVKGAGPARSALVIGWGILVLAFGMTQAKILPGSYHWIIRVLHLAVGMAAMGIADRLSRRMKAVHSHRPEVFGTRPI